MFIAAVSLRLARNTRESIEYRRQFEVGDITRKEYDQGISLQRSRINNISWVSQHTVLHRELYPLTGDNLNRCTLTLGDV